MAVITRKLILLDSVLLTLLLSRLAPGHLVASSFTWTVFLTFSIQSLALGIYNVVLYPRLFSPLRHLPTAPGGNFFMGQMSRIMKEPSGMPQRAWIKSLPNKGLYRYLTAFNVERVVVTSAQGLSEVLVTKSYDFIKPAQISQGIGRILGFGILFAENDAHRRQRKLLSPAFTYRHIKDLYPIFWAKACEMAHVVEAAASAAAIDATSTPSTIEAGVYTSRATLDIIGVAGFSRDFNALADPESKVVQTYAQVFHPTTAAKIMAYLGLLIPITLVQRLPFKRNNDMHAASSFIRQTCREIIHAKRAALEKNGEALGVDILSVALESGGFTDEELVDQLMTFAAAGHETTASAMMWAIYAMCKYPDMQTRLREELNAAGVPSPFSPGADKASVTADKIDRIPFLNAFCNEVLRFHSPVPFTMRIPSRPGLTVLNTPIPEGTMLILSPVAINFSPELWGADAEEFKPSRWLDPVTGQANNTGGANSNYAFLTFLHGPRSCIGQGFAKAEFAVLVAAWVLAFHTSLPDPSWVPDIGGSITTKPKGGLHVIVKKLD